MYSISIHTCALICIWLTSVFSIFKIQMHCNLYITYQAKSLTQWRFSELQNKSAFTCMLHKLKVRVIIVTTIIYPSTLKVCFSGLFMTKCFAQFTCASAAKLKCLYLHYKLKKLDIFYCGYLCFLCSLIHPWYLAISTRPCVHHSG